MSSNLSPDQKRALAARVNYYRDLGIYDFYRRQSDVARAPGFPSRADFAGDGVEAPSPAENESADRDAGVIITAPSPNMFAPDLPEKDRKSVV